MKTAEEWCNEGNNFYNAGQYQKAIECYNKTIEIDPSDAAAYFNRGIVKSYWGRNEAAIEDYSKAINIDPNDADVYINRGYIKSTLGLNKEAIEDYNKAIEVDPNYAMAYNNRGIEKRAMGRNKEAIEDYNKAIEIKPNDAAAYINRGKVKSDWGRNKEAIEDYNKAIEIKPNDADAYINRGIVKSNLGRNEAAIEDYSKAIEICPNSAVAYFNRGIVKNDLGLKEAAIEDYNKAIEIDSKYVAAYNCRGFVKQALERNEEAIEDYSKFIEICPNSAEAYNNRGIVKSALGRNEAAIEDYNKSIEKKNNLAVVYYNKGFALVKIKQYKEAVDCFEKARVTLVNIFSYKDLNEEEKKILAEILINKGKLFDKDKFFYTTTSKVEKEKYKKIYLLSCWILGLLHIEDENELKVAHYSSKKTFQTLLLIDKTTPFRLYSITNSNDYKEGITLLDYLKIDISNKRKIDGNYGAFAGCFTFNHDCLNQFRLYGKEDGKEGSGVSIILKDGFFEKFTKAPTEKNNGITTDKEKAALFRCIYIDPKTTQVISVGQKEEYTFYRDYQDEKVAKEKIKKYRNKISEILDAVNEKLSELKEMVNGLDPEVVSQLLINLRYLTKHVAFKEEQECRIVKILSFSDKNVKIDENNRHLYIDYLPPVEQYMDKICFGTHFTDMNLYKNWLKKKDLGHVVCEQSEHPLM
jgi:tetratricopeptide (TPR) repeat protein